MNRPNKIVHSDDAPTAFISAKTEIDAMLARL